MNQGKTSLLITALSAVTATFLLTSCLTESPYEVEEYVQKRNLYYIPSMPNSPLSSRKKDVNVNLTRSSGKGYRGLELQASYLPTEHVGIIGSWSYLGDASYLFSQTSFRRFELGAGYIKKLSNGWHFETYGGGGGGKIQNNHFSGSSNINFAEFFLQPGFAYNNQKSTFTFGLISRFAASNFSVQDISFASDRESYSFAQLKNLSDNPLHIMWEPSIMFRAGWKKFKFHGGYTLSADLTDPSLNRSKNNLSLGVSLQFNTSKK